MKMSELEIYLAAYLYNYKILVEFNNGEVRLLNMIDKFNSPAALKWSPLSKFMDIHFDSNHIWWGDKDSPDSMLISASTVYNLSAPCLSQFSYKLNKLDHKISDFYDCINTITFDIDDIISECRGLLTPMQNSTLLFARKRVKSKYKEIIKIINKASGIINKIIELIKKRTQIYLYLFEFDRKQINNFLIYIERNMCDINLLKCTSNKEAYNFAAKAYNKYIELVQKFNGAVYTYNKIHNTNLLGIQTIIMSIRVPVFEKKYIKVPEYLFKISPLVWDDWRADISEKGQCTKYICRLIIGGDEKTSALDFYFVFIKESQPSSVSEPWQFKYLIAYRYTEPKWFMKRYSPSELEKVKLIAETHDDPLAALELEECVVGNNPLNHI